MKIYNDYLWYKKLNELGDETKAVHMGEADVKANLSESLARENGERSSAD